MINIPAVKKKEKKHLEIVQLTQKTPAVCIVGFSGSGKTTVVVGLVKELSRRGINVGTIKHDVHGFEMDLPGKDSWCHKQAGAITTIISSPSQIGMVKDVSHDHNPLELISLFSGMDIVLVEGFKKADLLKIEVYREENRKPPACRKDKNLLAVISDAALYWEVPCFTSKDFEGIVDMLVQQYKLIPNLEASSKQAVC